MNTTFGIGNVLGTGFKIWIKNFVPFMLITALIYSPLWIWGFSTVRGEMTTDKLMSVARFERLEVALIMVFNIVVSAALVYGVVMELRGQRASIGACITTGLVRFFPALGAALLSILCIFAAPVLVLFLAALYRSTGGLILGFLLFIPAIIFACMFYVATPAAVLDRPGVVGALKRSSALTQGHKFEIFGLCFLLGLLGFGLGKLVQSVTLPHLGEREYFQETLKNIPTYLYATLGLQMVLGSLGSVMSGVAYYFLRSEKEGTSADELARIFD